MCPDGRRRRDLLGQQRYRQLGDGDIVDHRAPSPVTDLSGGVTAIAAGPGRSCALTATGGVKCWGFVGYLEDGGTPFFSLLPRDVPGLSSGVAAVATGGEMFWCAVMATGTMACWGDDSNGQLGLGRRIFSATPLEVTVSDKLAAGVALDGLSQVFDGSAKAVVGDHHAVWTDGRRLLPGRQRHGFLDQHRHHQRSQAAIPSSQR